MKSQDSQETVSVVIPFYNEADQVGLTLEATEAVLKGTGLDYEILALDDGSRDRTWEVLLDYAGRHPGIRLIRLSRNFGKEAGLCAGLDQARGDAVIVMDGDLQHPPRYIPEMIALWQEGYQLVEGVKCSRGKE